MTEYILKEAAATPDPERSLKNLSSFLEENPELAADLQQHIRSISMLFSFSQFLANYSDTHPEDLFDAIHCMENVTVREDIAVTLKQEFDRIGETPQRTTLPLYMNAVRRFRLKEILKITLSPLTAHPEMAAHPD